MGVGFDPKYAQWGGQGGAFHVDTVKIAAFIVCNALGAIHGRKGEKRKQDRKTGETFSTAEPLKEESRL